jgi:hypothetical protein
MLHVRRRIRSTLRRWDRTADDTLDLGHVIRAMDEAQRICASGQPDLTLEGCGR